jgi:hypothetical protein
VSDRSHSALKRIMGAGLVLGGMSVGVYALAGAPVESHPTTNVATGSGPCFFKKTCTNSNTTNNTQTVVGISTTGNTVGNVLGTVGNILGSPPKPPTNNTQTVVGISTTGNTVGNVLGTVGNILGR